MLAESVGIFVFSFAGALVDAGADVATTSLAREVGERAVGLLPGSGEQAALNTQKAKTTQRAIMKKAS
jgi:hypothetical protein